MRECLFSSGNLKVSLTCCVCCLCSPSSSNRFGSTANRLVVMIVLHQSGDEHSTLQHRLIALALSGYCWPSQRHWHATVASKYCRVPAIHYILAVWRVTDTEYLLAHHCHTHRRTTHKYNASRGDKILLPLPKVLPPRLMVVTWWRASSD